MKAKLGHILMTLGTVLVAAALGLVLFNNWQDSRAGQSADLVLGSLKQAVEPDTPKDEWQQAGLSDEMTVREIDGHGYIGYLSMPSLELELPVMDQWDEARLQIAPCRQFGTTGGGDLVIAGHNYRRHFGPINRLVPGDEILFTDMAGKVWRYLVDTVQTISPLALDVIQDDQWQLVLYTCDYSGSRRIMAGCVLVDCTEPESTEPSDNL